VAWSYCSSKYIYNVDCRVILVGPKMGHTSLMIKQEQIVSDTLIPRRLDISDRVR
jgi:hypothetical protein